MTLGANAWQTFWRITWPAIRWATAYGVVLTTARALGEFGAVSVVSGRLSFSALLPLCALCPGSQSAYAPRLGLLATF